MDSHDLYLVHREALEAALEAICRRFRLAPADAEDFAGEFRLRLMKEDYATLRQFEGRSSIGTFLRVVVTRAFQDWRNARWGKWRTSAEAKRLGPLAERLEILIVRDRYTLDEAEGILRTNLGVAESRATLEAIAARFPPRQSRTFVTDDALEGRAGPDAPPDRLLEQGRAGVLAASAEQVLRRAASTLPPEEQIILRMRFQDCMSVADIARALHLEQKPLYRRIERILLDLRRSLEAQGITSQVAVSLLDAGGFRETAVDVRLMPETQAPALQRERAQ